MERNVVLHAVARPPIATRRPIAATDLSQFIRLENCERYLRFRLLNDEVSRLLDHYGVTEQPLTPLLQASGALFEEALEAAIDARYTLQRLSETDSPAETVAALRGVGRRMVVLSQAPLTGELHGWPCQGVADLIWANRDAAGHLQIAIADIKASRKDRVEHRLQVTFYGSLLREMLLAAGEQVSRLSGAVLRMADGGGIPDVARLRDYAFELAPYELALEHLLGPGGVAERILAAPLEQARYHLSPKCDGCLYNALCMVESADRRDLALIPELSPVARRLLQSSGVTTLDALAALKELPAQPRLPLPVAPGQEHIVAALAGQWQVGPHLDLLVQRARALLTRFGTEQRPPNFLLGIPFPRLPDSPGLVKVFLDAQYDYLQERLYLIGALVVGPGGTREIVKMMPAPPEQAADERDLLVGVLVQLLGAIHEVAEGAQAPLHFYLYDRHDQKVLLDALRRHLPELGAIPALFDLLTEHEALHQAMVSFLADEVRTQRNLPATSTSLYMVAGNSFAPVDGVRQRFNWRAPHDFQRLFWARIFDNRQAMVVAGGRMRRAAPEEREGVLWVESASRFNSQIPLEYAYGAWDRLPDPNDRWRRAGPAERRLLAAFRRVSVDDLLAFQAHRLRAMAHIEASFATKNPAITKHPLSLESLGQGSLTPVPLQKTLEEFLYLEYHASLQEKLAHYAMPPIQRAATGRSLMLRCLEATPEFGRFEIDWEAAGLDPALALHAVRLKEGDWVVLSVAETPSAPWRVLGGRLAEFAKLEGHSVLLFWRDLPKGKNQFRHHHERLQPLPGAHYMLDEMADDLVADKVLAACRQAGSNALYRWIEAHQPPPLHTIPPGVSRAATAFLRLVQRVEAPHAPTAAQTSVIGDQFAPPIVLVQGPPGTGKSHTIGWAVLARLAARLSNDQPMRVAIVCKTHTAVAIALGSVAAKARHLGSTTLTGPEAALAATLRPLEIFKLDPRDQEPLPPGVTGLDCYGARNVLEGIVGRSPVVLGGTPGGLYNMMKYRSAGGKEVLWDEKPFDLVVIDEASQMTLPETLLASAFLRPDGQLLVVGDHRQMPPILAHPWDEEERRHLASAQPYRSAFEYLRDLKVPSVALDESFRLHREQAAFLNEGIYQHDGIRFFSRQARTWTPPPSPDAFLQAVLRPDVPIVVIEHGEAASQQFNATEIELLTPLLDHCLREAQLDGAEGLGVVVPHRAQRAALSERFPTLAAAGGIDTVERFQGGERDIIFVSTTASDPDFVLAEASFLLDPKRLNVALSRPRKKLIVVASQSLFRLLSSDLELFAHASLWKRLRYGWTTTMLWSGERAGTGVQVWGHAG